MIILLLQCCITINFLLWSGYNTKQNFTSQATTVRSCNWYCLWHTVVLLVKTHTHNRLTAFVRDNPGRPVPEETLTHSHPTWSLDILYHLPPFTMIHGILFVHFTCSTILSDNLSPGPFWSSSWSWTLNFILHTFLHPIIIIFSQHMPIPTQPVLLQNHCYVIYT